MEAVEKSDLDIESHDCFRQNTSYSCYQKSDAHPWKGWCWDWFHKQTMEYKLSKITPRAEIKVEGEKYEEITYHVDLRDAEKAYMADKEWNQVSFQLFTKLKLWDKY